MPLIHDSAIVLRRLDFSESSQVMALLTREHGKVRIIAKGSRRSTKKRFSPGLDLLESGTVVFSARHVGQEALATLVEWKQRATFSGLREALSRWHAGYYAADICGALVGEWDPHPALYDALIRTLNDLSRSSEVMGPVVSFQRALLEESGVSPQLELCVGCGRAPGAGEPVYFSSFEGGLLCRDCEPARVEKRNVTVRLGALRGDGQMTRADLGGAFDLFNYHITHQMGREPASSDVLTGLARPKQGS